MTTCLRAWSAAWLEALYPLPDPDLDGQATDGCLKRRIYQGLHDGARGSLWVRDLSSFGIHF
jgi:hypothetical protein